MFDMKDHVAIVAKSRGRLVQAYSVVADGSFTAVVNGINKITAPTYKEFKQKLGDFFAEIDRMDAHKCYDEINIIHPERGISCLAVKEDMRTVFSLHNQKIIPAHVVDSLDIPTDTGKLRAAIGEIYDRYLSKHHLDYKVWDVERAFSYSRIDWPVGTSIPNNPDLHFSPDTGMFCADGEVRKTVGELLEFYANIEKTHGVKVLVIHSMLDDPVGPHNAVHHMANPYIVDTGKPFDLEDRLTTAFRVIRYSPETAILAEQATSEARALNDRVRKKWRELYDHAEHFETAG